MLVVMDPKLTIYIEFEDEGDAMIPVWSLEGNQGKIWNKGTVPIIANKPYKVGSYFDL